MTFHGVLKRSSENIRVLWQTYRLVTIECASHQFAEAILKQNKNQISLNIKHHKEHLVPTFIFGDSITISVIPQLLHSKMFLERKPLHQPAWFLVSP